MSTCIRKARNTLSLTLTLLLCDTHRNFTSLGDTHFQMLVDPYEFHLI